MKHKSMSLLDEIDRLADRGEIYAFLCGLFLGIAITWTILSILK